MAEAITIKDVRLSFPVLFTPEEFQKGDGKPRFGASFIVEPGSAADKAISEAINATATEAFKAKAGEIIKAAKAKGSQGFCYVEDGGGKSYDGYEGMNILSTSRALDKGRPGVYDRDRSPLVEADGKPYAGCYVNARVEFWAQDNTFGKSVRCTLVSVQFSKDGDAFSAGSKPTEDDFEDLSNIGDDEPPL